MAVLLSDDVYRLLTYASFNINLQITLSVAALLVFRYRRLHHSHREIDFVQSGESDVVHKYRTPLFIPIVTLGLQVVLTIIAPLFYYPKETGLKIIQV